MSREKQIEEMAHDLCHWWNGKGCTFGSITNKHFPCRYECNAFTDAERLYTAGYRKQEWISVDDRLPEEGKYVIVWVGSVQVARIEKGITEEERQKMKNGEIDDRIEYGWIQSTVCIPLKRSDLYKACDVHGNNRVPYRWKANGGPMEWFGQNVTHWMPLPETPKMKGGAE